MTIHSAVVELEYKKKDRRDGKNGCIKAWQLKTKMLNEQELEGREKPQ